MCDLCVTFRTVGAITLPKFFAVTTIAEREYQTIKLADHTQLGGLPCTSN